MPRAVVRIVANGIPKLAAAMKPRAIAVVSRSAANIEATAKGLAPVDTGTLRRSIHQEPRNDALSKEIGPSVDYGLYQELGTRYMPAHPYMTPAALAEQPRFLAAMKEIADA